MSTQPTALRLADEVAAMQPAYFTSEVAAELRRLHEVNQELLAALKRIKATGVFVGAIAQEMMDAAIAKAEKQACA